MFVDIVKSLKNAVSKDNSRSILQYIHLSMTVKGKKS